MLFRPVSSPIRPVAHFQTPPGPASLPEIAGNQSTPLTLADVEQMAIENNPALAAAAGRRDAAFGQQMQAGYYPNPVAGYHATEIGNVGTAGQQGGFMSQRIVTAGKLKLDQAIAAKQVEAASFSLVAAEKRVLTDVRSRFYDALVAQRRVELTNQLVEIGDNLVKASKKLLDGGRGTENDLLQSQIRAEQAGILHTNAQNESTEAWQRLTAVIGLPAMAMHRLEGQLDAGEPSYQWDECYRMVLSNHPELNAAMAKVQQAKIAIVRAKREPIPNVDVWVSTRHHNVTGSDVVNLQVGVPIPIFNRNQGNIRSAEAEWFAANEELRRIELDLIDRLAVAYRRYANARQQAVRYQTKIVPQALKSLDLVTQGYDKGQVEYLTLLTAQQTYVEVSLAYLDSLRELWASAAVIEGQLLTGSLKPSQ